MRIIMIVAVLFVWTTTLALSAGEPVSRDAATERLFRNLQAVGRSECFLFGQANALTLSYSGGPKHAFNGKSDVKDIAGSHPAFVESDFMWYTDAKFKTDDVAAMREAYRLGIVCGYCWHMKGLHSGSFYYKKDKNEDGSLVKEILAEPNRAKNKSLDWFLLQYETNAIPVLRELGFPLIFRPLHEMTGGWFWWGSATCTPEEYVRLYRLVVTHLRTSGIRNLLYAWSPDGKADFRYYPGDEYVDVIGYDTYEPGVRDSNSALRFVSNVQTLADYAVKHDKVAAITETGCREAYPATNFNFWTENVLRPLKSGGKKKIAYVMTWYNSDWNHNGRAKAFVPYLGMESRPGGEKAIADFKSFSSDPAVLLAGDLAALKIYSVAVTNKISKQH